MVRFPRKQSVHGLRKIIRIYTEGEKTEPNYFNSIKGEVIRHSLVGIEIKGLGDHVPSIVDRVIKIKESETDKSLETEWWVVFDKDSHPEFDKSVHLAEKNGIRVAYSNECFELWFILHFELLNTSLGRNNHRDKLTKLLNQKYDKSSSDIYSLIRDKEEVAIRNAKKLELDHDKENKKEPSKRNPSTTVYKLVERLRELK
ncbi:MAG: RloB family protein [Candidatus Paceibacterota bacterium]|jgi:hypothetical protein